MPELAEVEYFRKQWDPGMGKVVKAVKLHAEKRIFRDADPGRIIRALTGSKLKASYAHGKQMLFEFRGGGVPRAFSGWLGIHLGMTGKLSTEPTPYAPDNHEHLVLEMAKQVLVFRDPRLFGKVLFDCEPEFPGFWANLPPSILSDAFTRDELKAFLARRSKRPLKAILLMQERFPGIGNWMADEILWQARLHPAMRGGEVSGKQLTALYQSIRQVSQGALDTVGVDWSDPPDHWLFAHRWKDGGICPKTGEPLVREEIGGRTTCWSPAWQKSPQLFLFTKRAGERGH